LKKLKRQKFNSSVTWKISWRPKTVKSGADHML